jgi:hypothetical protein
MQFEHVVAPASKRAKLARSAAARSAVRAAKRALECVNLMDGEYILDMVITEIESQLAELDDETTDTTEEYNDIIKTLKLLEMQWKNKFAGETNKTATFTCAICLVDQPLSTLRLFVPCGHGFCATCTEATQQQDILACPNCRGPIASVLKAYV